MGEPGTKEILRLEDLEAAGSIRTGRKHTLSVLVENKAGVLSRVAGLFARRGFNIATLAVGPSGVAGIPGAVWVSYELGGNILASGAAVNGLGLVGAFSAPETAPGSTNGDYGSVSIGPAGQVLVNYQDGLAAAVAGAAADKPAANGLQTLVDRFRNERGGRTVVGSLPVHVTFPVFGPSIFLASELTAEGRAPFLDLTFKRARN